MFKFFGIIFCALFFLVGCSTAPPQTSLNWQDTNVIVQPVVVQTNKTVVPTVKSNPPPAMVPTPKPAPVAAWTSLESWAAEHKIGKVHKLSNSPVVTCAIGSGNGVMILTIGSLEAAWNGIEINLGFAPELIDGEMFLNELDLKKNLEPLLCEPPLTFSKTNHVIVIDPGHGGSNHGTYSVLDGRFEKEFTLDWAKRLKPLLEAEGWEVFLTRTSDVYVTNSDRVVFAGAHHADLFISLHFNSTDQDKKTGKRNEKAGGLETYCITPTGMPSTLTRDFGDNWSDILPNNAFDAQNIRLAVRVHSALLHAVGMEDHGVRRSRFDTVLRGQNHPAILVEGGYLSNPAEAKLIESPEYRQKLAEAVAAALR
ncbi:MAG TPA: N-acetylmuramoyl-L-alanine amidase [Verrucomicrobiae bacterium]|nr:N-acetylmuramoyl-L-alanine amidase [Verrucomicrobiae bacterium]